MKQFTLVVQQVTSEELEKVLAIQSKSNSAIKWTPQQNNANGVTVPDFSSQIVQRVANGKQEPIQIYNNLRLDWDEKSAHLARQILDVFTSHQPEQVKAG